MSFDELIDPSQLPRRKPGTGKTSTAQQTTINAQDMRVKGKRDGIEEEGCRNGPILKRCQKCQRQSLHHWVIDSP